MATTSADFNKSPSTSPGAEGIEWDESSIQSSLTHLQDMHIQLRHLRETIPSLMRAVHAQHSSPEDLYASIERAAMRAVNDIKTFTACIEEPTNQDVLRNARQSQGKSAKGIKSWLVTQHPHWLEKTVETGVKELKIEEDAVSDAERYGDSVQEDIHAIVAKFKEQHAGIDVALNSEGTKLNMSLTSPIKLSFEIDLQPKPTSTEMYNVSLRNGSTPLQAAIIHAVSKRTRQGGLPVLLEMLSSYSDVTTRQCQKCNKLFDSGARFPVVRVRNGTSASEATNPTEWQALHMGCHYGNRG